MRILSPVPGICGGSVWFSALSWERGGLKVYWWLQMCAPHCPTSKLVYAVSHHLASALASHVSPSSFPPSAAAPCPAHCQASCHSPNMWPLSLCQVRVFLCRHCPLTGYMVGAHRRGPLASEIGEQEGWDGDGYIKKELKVEGFSVLFLEFPLKIKIFVYSPNDGGPELI